MASLYEHNIFRFWTAIPLGVFWITVLVALAYIESLAGAPLKRVLRLVTAPVALVGLGHFVHSFIRVRWACRTYGRFLPEFMRRMVLMFPQLSRFLHETTKVILHLVLAVFGLMLAGVTGTYSVLMPSALLLGVASTAFLRVVLPPGGVYLASSDPERISFLKQLNRNIIPGFAALLEVSNFADPSQKGFSWKDLLLLQNDFRTTDLSNWPDVVKQLIEMAAIVVVDGRDRSAGLELEVKRILKNRLEFKTVFLWDGTLPSLLSSLNAKSSHPSGTFMMMTPDQALQVLPALINNAKAFWHRYLTEC
jgi:hypothetical protein